MATLGGTTADLQNTLVSAAVLLPAFLISTRCGINRLASVWLVATPVILMLNFPRIGNVLGLRFADVALAVWAPVVAGGAMYALVTVTRATLGEAADLYRLPLLIAVGAATYFGVASACDHRIWRDVKRTTSALRDGAGRQSPDPGC